LLCSVKENKKEEDEEEEGTKKRRRFEQSRTEWNKAEEEKDGAVIELFAAK
jgi:hypothetical protein